jgi:hypothetical protein
MTTTPAVEADLSSLTKETSKSRLNYGRDRGAVESWRISKPKIISVREIDTKVVTVL